MARGSSGDDVVYLGPGDDTNRGRRSSRSWESGDDEIHGGSGRDIFGGGAGLDLLYGGPGSDFIGDREHIWRIWCSSGRQTGPSSGPAACRPVR